jgi:hypothetical protein
MKENDKIKKHYKDILPDDLNQILENDIKELEEKVKYDEKSIDVILNEIIRKYPDTVFTLKL